jgi:starch synthase (maltosyl-transferring)
LKAGEVRLFRAEAEPFILLAQPQVKRGAKTADKKAVTEAIAAPRVSIESVTPSVDHGRFPAKRIVGEAVEIQAAIFAEGHDKIAAAVQWRAADETDWHEAPMRAVQPAGLDLWSTRIPLERVGRHEFVVMAWRDDFASLVDHMQKKLKAGQTVELEVEEAKHLFALILAEVKTADDPDSDSAPLDAIVKEFTKADDARKLELTLAPATAKAIAAARHRPFLSRDPVVYRVDAERAAARFASWYEIFPRSMSDDVNRHGTFIDVIGKLPRIREMGFDVLYFPPIHPIGVANRKVPAMSAARMRSAARKADIPPCIRSSAISTTSSACSKPRMNMDSRSRSTSRCNARPIIRGSRNIRRGSRGVPTARCVMRRIRRRSIRTSTTSTSSPRTGKVCGRRCFTSSCTGSSGA